MSDHHAPDKFEETDWDAKPVVVTVVVLFLFLLLGIAVAAVTESAFMKLLDRNENATQFHDTKTLPPEPRLQIDEAGDLRTFRDKEDAVLEAYEWVDPSKTVLRIPIDRAIDLVAAEESGGRK